jgi:hypothetical protein
MVTEHADQPLAAPLERPPENLRRGYPHGDPPKAAGTFGFNYCASTMLHHGTLPSPSVRDSQSDIDAVAAGDVRRVSCYLRATYDSYPHRPKQGFLDVTSQTLTWSYYWRRKLRPIDIDLSEMSLDVGFERRTPLAGKPSRWALEQLADPTLVLPPSHQRTRIVARSVTDSVELSVPTADAPLVLHYLRAHR